MKKFRCVFILNALEILKLILDFLTAFLWWGSLVLGQIGKTSKAMWG